MLFTPADFGLPESFKKFREGQMEVAARAAFSRATTTALEAPTGTGKSAIGMLIHLLMLRRNPMHRTLYLTGSKGLMDQIETEFRPLEPAMIRGANNYDCYIGSCEDGAQIDCDDRRGPQPCCPYLLYKRRASKSSLVFSNYHYLVSLVRSGDDLGAFDLIIADEAHTLLKLMTDLCTIKIDMGEPVLVRNGVSAKLAKIGQSLLTDLSSTSMTKVEGEHLKLWSSWANVCTAQAEQEFNRLKSQSANISRLKQVSNFFRALSHLAEAKRLRTPFLVKPQSSDAKYYNQRLVQDRLGYRDDISIGSEIVLFTPIWPAKHVSRFVYSQASRRLLMSGTINRSMLSYLDVQSTSELDYITVESPFDPARNPFYIYPLAKIDFNMPDGALRLLMKTVDRFLESRLDMGYRIVFHTRSYDWQARIYALSALKKFMISHASGQTRAAFETFRTRKPPVIILSPDLHTGWDLAGDICRSQIMWKAPTIWSGDEITKARAKDDKEYKTIVEANDTEQLHGRVMRFPSDFGETITFDRHVDNWFLDKIRPYVTEHFKKTWRFVNTMPRPISF